MWCADHEEEEIDKIKENDIKESFRREYFKRAKLIIKNKSNETNETKINNTWAMLLIK